MHVVQIIDTLSYGGAQMMQVMLARAMCKFSDIDLTLVSLRDDTNNAPFADQLKSLGVRVEFFSASKLWNLKRFWQLLSFLRCKKFDIIHSHLPYANIIAILAAKLLGVPVIASLRNSQDDGSGRFFFIRDRLEALLLRYAADKVMAVGHSTAQAQQKRLGRKKIEAVPNALDIIHPLAESERDTIRTELVEDPTSPVVISVGRLAPQKGYDDLLVAFVGVIKKYPKANLVIAGDGPLRDFLAGRIIQLRLSQNVRLLGARNDVPRLLLASDLFVNSSHWEGLSVALLEAMASSLPIVATNVSDTPRLVVDKVGLVVPPQAPDKLMEAIMFFLDDPVRRKTYGAEAQAFIARNHSPEAWIGKIISMYKDVLKVN